MEINRKHDRKKKCTMYSGGVLLIAITEIPREMDQWYSEKAILPDPAFPECNKQGNITKKRGKGDRCTYRVQVQIELPNIT